MDSEPKEHLKSAKRQNSENCVNLTTKKPRCEGNECLAAATSESGIRAVSGTTNYGLEEEVARLHEEVATRKSSEIAIKKKYDNLVTRLLAKVECPVCLEVPKEPPIHVCPNGHVVCKICRRDSCSTCRVRMGQGTSILALTVIENITHSCEYQLNGCDTTLELLQLKAHQSKCQFRTIKCPNYNCPEKVPLNTLEEHSLRRCIHKGTFYSSPLCNSYNYIIPSTQPDLFDRRSNSNWRPDGIAYDGRYFFLKITRKGRRGNWYFFVQMAGGEDQSIVYTVNISVFPTTSNSDGRNSHRFIGEVCPIDVNNIEEAAEAGYALVLSDNQMKKVFAAKEAVENRRFQFSVSVKMSKEEKRDEHFPLVDEDVNADIVEGIAHGSNDSERVSMELERAQEKEDRAGRIMRIVRILRAAGSPSSTIETRPYGYGHTRSERFIISDDEEEAGPSNNRGRFSENTSPISRSRGAYTPLTNSPRRFDRIAVAARDSSSEDDDRETCVICLQSSQSSGVIVHSVGCPER